MSISQEMKELVERRDSLNNQLKQMKEELTQIDEQLEQHTQQRETAKRQYAVTKSQIKQTDNDIFQLKQRFKILKDTAQLLNTEVHDIQIRLNQLEPVKNERKQSILHLKNRIKETKQDNQVLQEKITENRSRLAQLSSEKQQLSDQIASLLSKTELDQETIESELLQINEKYINRLNQTNERKQQCSQLISEFTDTQDQIKGFKSKLSELMRVKVLNREVASLATRLDQHQKDNDLYKERLQTLKKSLANKKISLSRITEENKHRNSQIQSLESTVGKYDKALTTFTTTESQYQDVNHQVEIDMDAVRQMLEDQNTLAYSLNLAEEKSSIIIADLMKGDF
jgi:chromosome segregation protein